LVLCDEFVEQQGGREVVYAAKTYFHNFPKLLIDGEMREHNALNVVFRGKVLFQSMRISNNSASQARLNSAVSYLIHLNYIDLMGNKFSELPKKLEI